MKNITTNHLQHQVYYTINIPGIFQEITLGARARQQSTKEESAYLCVSTSEHWRLTNTHIHTHTSWHERPDRQENPSLFSTFSTHTKPTQRACVQICRSNREHTHTCRNTHVCGVSECDSMRGYTQRTQRRLQCGHMTSVCVPERKYVHEYAHCCVCACKWRGNKWRETLQTAIKEMWI